ncbi:amino acid ABC transporter permease [Vannielia litorea]|uniref:L-glutamine ABC transporter membrane protein /L-glutamate ABC transporter membrane protein /L-aspartate ABC transporter membrane protein /L-asparagine ABC transporter membrane protein n=1 Tax=Vannielia litorea TaxID=1217970 RepID=A0A1N6IBN3_9RHOB|nr:ABC transporter permease subunit [Vannielia litorea]SIO29379.1 L-glutamine ABC transporter membrane protein /L-glutamate ABC transporter membrane protein /L-aspartate ABC transporter membrane protein /L-asparagine ABC transporter membrane protein [Vannielia litorea]
MATVTDPPKAAFRLSMLIYDTRYRSMTIQVVALIGFLLLVGFLISNTAQNLATSGKTVSFDFLSKPAGYDINQTLIEYNNQNSHLRAAFIGLLNTLLVAVLGCATATVLGVIIGVLRLSPNWLIGRLMTVYVEMFRNVPVLLWIVFAMAVLIETLPPPSAFRGDEPAATMKVFDTVAITNRGVYIPEPLFSRSLGDIHLFGQSALNFDVSIDLLLIVAAVVGGILGARFIKRRADRIQEATGLRPTTWYLRLASFVLPVLIVLIALGFHLGYPALQGFNFQDGTYLRNSLIALWLALSLYTAAFIAENVRAGILAISSGQTEAAGALGLRPKRIMSLVILPQALRVIIPPLISQYLNLTKNSSLAIAVGYMDLTGTLMGITLNQTGKELETLLLGMLIYLIISLSISALMNWYNNRVKLVER